MVAGSSNAPNLLAAQLHKSKGAHHWENLNRSQVNTNGHSKRMYNHHGGHRNWQRRAAVESRQERDSGQAMDYSTYCKCKISVLMVLEALEATSLHVIPLPTSSPSSLPYDGQKSAGTLPAKIGGLKQEGPPHSIQSTPFPYSLSSSVVAEPSRRFVRRAASKRRVYWVLPSLSSFWKSSSDSSLDAKSSLKYLSNTNSPGSACEGSGDGGGGKNKAQGGSLLTVTVDNGNISSRSSSSSLSSYLSLTMMVRDDNKEDNDTCCSRISSVVRLGIREYVISSGVGVGVSVCTIPRRKFLINLTQERKSPCMLA